MKKNQKNNYIIVSAIFFVGVIIGWVTGRLIFSGKAESQNSLRLGGYKFISPLLVCDTNAVVDSIAWQPLQAKIKDYISSEISNGKLETASVYFRDINTGEQFNVNASEKYFPASLNKVPLLIAVLKAAEDNPALLQKSVSVNLSKDYNTGQEIPPSDPVKIGQSYTVEELLNKMVKHSDNNAMYAIIRVLDQQTYEKVYKDLNLTYPQNMTDQPDFMSTSDFAYFLRILYNSTYLKRDLSEKALEIMGDVDFSDGLKAGVPENISVSHKFGLETSIDGPTGQVTGRQMHDCGIVYETDTPYMLCVMTKSKTNVAESEEIIKNISETVYNYAPE